MSDMSKKNKNKPQQQQPAAKKQKNDQQSMKSKPQQPMSKKPAAGNNKPQQQPSKKDKQPSKPAPAAASESEEEEDNEDVAVAEELLRSMDEIQQEIETVDDELAAEIVKLEQQYATRRAPLLKKRDEVIKKIDGFWKTLFERHEAVSSILDEVDSDILDSLVEFNVSDNTSGAAGFTLTFTFGDNEFFKNKTLTKKYVFDPENGAQATPSPIEWKNKKFSDDHPDSFFVNFFNPELDDALEELGEAFRVIHRSPVEPYLQIMSGEDMSDDDIEFEDDEDDEDAPDLVDV